MLRKRLSTLLFGLTFLLAACSASENDAAVEYEMSAAGENGEPMEQMLMTAEEPFARSYSAAWDDTVEAQEEKTESANDVGQTGTMSYFTFAQEAADYVDEAGNKLLVEQLTAATYQSADPEAAWWINGFLEQNYYQDADFSQGLLNFAESNLTDLGEENFYTHSHYVSMGVGRHDATLISLLHLSSAYSGGVHPNSIQTSFNLDLEDRRVLRLEDVIYEGADDALIRRVREAVENKFSSIGEVALYENYADTITTALTYGNMTPYWYFNDDGLVIYFNQYELGPYAAGIISAHLAYEDLGSIVKPEYMPGKLTGTAENVTVSDALTTGQPDYQIDFGPGETIYITIEGTAYHVRFSEVYWAETTPVGQLMMFSADHIEDGAVIAVNGGIFSPERIYAIEYCDESGSHLLYLRDGKAYSEPPLQ